MKNILVALSLFVGMFVHADEGMWFLMFLDRLNQRDMEKMGLQLTSEEIYSINNSSLKDAIVQFNGGCTAELVSSEGLVLTNHHCGYSAIAELSTPENDYLTNGFWAGNKQEEMKPNSLFVRFFVRMDDVSQRMLGVLNDEMSEKERNEAIKTETAKIEEENSEDGKYVVSVRSFFQGNEYYYFVYQDYTDVRLVGTPPASVGKFGGDTDNWEWPRHTGDFSMFRVYADSDGNPAEYSTDNVPLKPKHHLPVNIQGIDKDDFAMILGYPGRTNRWLPAGGIDQNVKFAYPAWVEASKKAMDVMKKYMDKDNGVRLNYASKYAGVANYWKNRQGMIDALTKFETANSKAKNEAKFDKWTKKKMNAKYSGVIKDINDYYALTNDKARHDNYLRMVFRGSKFATISRSLGRVLTQYAEDRSNLDLVYNGIDDFIATSDLNLEMDMLKEMLTLYAGKANYTLPETIDEYSNESSLDLYLESILELSIFTSEKRLNAFITVPSKELLENDPLMVLSNKLIAHYFSSDSKIDEAKDKFDRAYRMLVDGMRESGLSPVIYPDANSTLRLTYGKVSPLPKDPRNDAKENYYTTLKGTVKKFVEDDPEFDLPQGLIDLYESKDFGPYADEDGYMPVNFLTNNDITGGNSGSPVLNGKGELIGLAFDGNIEAMAGDVIFDNKLQKTINVDIRYVLFLIDKYAGAKHIVEEMTVIK
ncbi:MAG: S46 family peptidase [Flavobacteriales bacterium]|nr:S46 family peptidase [Flavobacteriales bacterium]